MIQETTIDVLEGNKLIAEFMEATDYKFKNINARDYHSSWDWLMRVVQRIQDIEVTPPPNYTCYRIEIMVQGYVKIEGPFPFPRIFKNVSKCGSLINAVWQAVVEFIKNYNIKNNPE